MKAFAVEEITSQADLVTIARHADDWFHRRAAVLRLEDQATLATVAVGDDHWIPRLAATTLLTSTSLLMNIMVEDADRAVRRTALDRLVALGAISRTTSPDTLATTTTSKEAS